MVNKSKKLLIQKVEKVIKLAEDKLDIDDKEFYEALDCLHDEIRDLPVEVSWILVSVRLPEIRELDRDCSVWATCHNGIVAKVKFNSMRDGFYPADDVVAWMPIPKPYNDLTEVFKKLFRKK